MGRVKVHLERLLRGASKNEALASFFAPRRAPVFLLKGAKKTKKSIKSAGTLSIPVVQSLGIERFQQAPAL